MGKLEMIIIHVFILCCLLVVFDCLREMVMKRRERKKAVYFYDTRMRSVRQRG